jgi:hypothetical protein
MVSSITPRLAPRWPSFTDTISIIKSRNFVPAEEVVLRLVGVNRG